MAEEQAQQQQIEELTYEAKRKIEDKKNFIMVSNIIIGLIENINKRHNAIKDPATRYAMLVDKLCLSLDSGIAIMKVMMNDLDIEPEMKIKIEDASDQLQQQLIGLMDWVISPVYGPDHPYGNSIMMNSKKDFFNKKE